MAWVELQAQPRVADLVSHSQAKECITVWQARRRTSTPRTSLGVLAASVSQRSEAYTHPRPWGPCRRSFHATTCHLRSRAGFWRTRVRRRQPGRPVQFGTDRVHRGTAGLERGASDQQCRVSSVGARDHHVQRPAGWVGQYHGRRHLERSSGPHRAYQRQLYPLGSHSQCPGGRQRWRLHRHVHDTSHWVPAYRRPLPSTSKAFRCSAPARRPSSTTRPATTSTCTRI